MYQKKSNVFWVQTVDGMLLQNVNTNIFIELDKVQEIVWEYLDGTFQPEQIADIIQERKKSGDGTELAGKVLSTIELLKNLDMIENNSYTNGNQQK